MDKNFETKPEHVVNSPEKNQTETDVSVHQQEIRQSEIIQPAQGEQVRVSTNAQFEKNSEIGPDTVNSETAANAGMQKALSPEEQGKRAALEQLLNHGLEEEGAAQTMEDVLDLSNQS